MNPEEAPKTPPEETPLRAWSLPRPIHRRPGQAQEQEPAGEGLSDRFVLCALLLLLISFVMQQRNHLALQD